MEQKKMIFNLNKLSTAIINIFEKVAIIRTRQALSFLSDNELSQLGITRHQLSTGNFYKSNEVIKMPVSKNSVNDNMIELEKNKAA